MYVKTLLALVTFLILITDARSAVNKNLRINSDPEGAEVFLLRGKKQTLLGVTPFDHRAKFHSDISILRINVKKSGFETLKTNLKATQGEYTFHLLTRSYGVSAESMKDTRLRIIQKKINPVIDSIIPTLIARGKVESDDLGPLRVTKKNNKVYLVVPLKLSKDKISAKIRSKSASFAKQVWGGTGLFLLDPLVAKLQKEKLLDGIFLDIEYIDAKKKFLVKSRVETKVEITCQGGYVQKQVYDACATTIQKIEYYTDSSGNMHTRNAGSMCQGGMVSRAVFEQCAFRVPITKSTVKSDHKTVANKNQYRVQYLLPFNREKVARKSKIEFQDLILLITDSRGSVLLAKGKIP